MQNLAYFGIKMQILVCFFGDYLLLLYHQIKKIMDLLHVIAVVALVIIGVFIYVNKKNG